MRVLITGGAGFIAHHLVKRIMDKRPDWEIVILDRLSYASRGLDRLRAIEALGDPQVMVLAVDFSSALSVGVIREIGLVNYIFHLGAESHVDNSVLDPLSFVEANVAGTTHLLEFARTQPHLRQFVYYSSDEVFGPSPIGLLREKPIYRPFREWDRHNPTNPYAASKSGGEMMALAYANTYGIPVLILNVMNVFGRRQHPEKFIPTILRRMIMGKSVEIHTDRDGVPGRRHYVHVDDSSDAILHLIGRHKTYPRTRFNLTGFEIDNLSMAEAIASILNVPLRYTTNKFRLGVLNHDIRYDLDGSKIAGFGWKSTRDFVADLNDVVNWTIDNREWLEVD
jgi:dTDP-glucose 4,6-dehydratase